MKSKFSRRQILKCSTLSLMSFLVLMAFSLFLFRNSIMEYGAKNARIIPVKLACLLGADIDKGVYLSVYHYYYPEDRDSYFEIFKLLLEQGANPNKKHKEGSTPFLHSCHMDLAFVKLFLKHGADIQTKSECGKTALHIGVANPNSDVLDYLIEKGLNVNEKDESGDTPLIISSRFCYYPEHIRILLQNGANVNIKNKKGHTALDYAIAKTKESDLNREYIQKAIKIANLLKEHGATISREGNPR